MFYGCAKKAPTAPEFTRVNIDDFESNTLINWSSLTDFFNYNEFSITGAPSAGYGNYSLSATVTAAAKTMPPGSTLWSGSSDIRWINPGVIRDFSGMTALGFSYNGGIMSGPSSADADFTFGIRLLKSNNEYIQSNFSLPFTACTGTPASGMCDMEIPAGSFETPTGALYSKSDVLKEVNRVEFHFLFISPVQDDAESAWMVLDNIFAR